MKSNNTIEYTKDSIQFLTIVLSHLELKHYWNKLKSNNAHIDSFDDIIPQDYFHLLTTAKETNSQNNNTTNTFIQSQGENRNISGSFNQSLNKKNNSYQNLLCKAIQDLKNDDSMFNYLHKELIKIKSPSICESTKSNINSTNRKKHEMAKVKKRQITIIKKKFLLNDDEDDEIKVLRSGNNVQLIEENDNKKCTYSKSKDLMQGDYNQTCTNGKTSENLILIKDNKYKHQIRYCNRFSLYDAIQYDLFSYYRLFINEIKQVACDYCYYSNLCYLIKVTSFHKYANRLKFLFEIMSSWRNITKIQNKNRIKNQVLYKQMNSLLLCAIKGMSENSNIKEPLSHNQIYLHNINK